MAGNVIKEFLVAIGFGVDKASQQKFESIILDATKNVAQLGATAVATATTVGLSVVAIARQFEDLYYVSQRTKVGVGTLQSYESGMKSIGVAADASRAAVEGMAQAVRTNVGLAQLSKQFGAGPGSTPQDLARGLKKQYGNLGEAGYQVAANFASMFSIDEQTFRQLWANIEKADAAKAKFDKRNKDSGVDLDRLAERGGTFGHALDSLGESLSRIGDQTADKWMPSMTKGIGLLDDLAQAAVKANKETDGWLATGISLVTALGALKTAGLLLRAIGLGGVAAATGAVAGPAAGVLGLGALGFLGAHTLGFIDWGAVSGAKSGKFGAAGSSGGDTAATDRRKQAIEYFKSQGWDEKTAVGMTMSLSGESGKNLDPRAYNAEGGGRGAHGIGQWRGKRLEDFKRVMGKDITDSTFEEQLAFHQWELKNTEKTAAGAISQATSAGGAAIAHSRMFERHGSAGEDMRRGAMAQGYFDANLGPAGGGGMVAPQITQKTEINVSGGASPAETGREIASQQSRVNGDMVRNLAGAIQ